MATNNSINANSTTPLPIVDGGTQVTSVTTAPAATAFAGWDANKNLSAVNAIEGYATTVTSATPIVLVVGSAYQQYLTGSTAQTVTLPVTSTLASVASGTAQSFLIVNNSSATTTVNSSGGNLVESLPAGSQAIFTCILNSGTTASSWSSNFVLNVAGVASITGTANQITASASTGAVTLSLPNNMIVTDWVAYTPTFTGFGTCTSINVWSRRIGNQLEIIGTFSSGTTTATQAQITLGYNGTNANVSSSSTVISTTSFAGDFLQAGGTASTFYTLIASNSGHITISQQSVSTNALTSVNGSQFNSSSNFSFTASVPIDSFA